MKSDSSDTANDHPKSKAAPGGSKTARGCFAHSYLLFSEEVPWLTIAKIRQHFLVIDLQVIFYFLFGDDENIGLHF